MKRSRWRARLLAAVALISSILASSVIVANQSSAAVQDIPSAALLDSVACPSVTHCLAVGPSAETLGSAVAPIDPATGTPSHGQIVQTVPNVGLNAVACPTPTLCLSVGSETGDPVGAAVPLDPSTGAIADGQSVQTNDVVGTFTSMACATPTECLAVGLNASFSGGVSVPLDPATGEIAPDQTTQAIAGVIQMIGVACPTTTQCVAVGIGPSGDSGRIPSGDPIVVSLNPVTGMVSAGQSVQDVLAMGFFNGIACSTTTQCLGIGTSNSSPSVGQAVPLDPATGEVPSGGSVQSITGSAVLEGIACPSSTQCIGTGTNADGADGQVVSLDPVDGTISGDQTVQAISGVEAFYGVSCSAATACLGVGIARGPAGVAVPLDPATGAQPITPGSYTPLAPVRICDTRAENVSQINTAPFNQCDGQTIAAGGTLTINVANEFPFNVPANATAVVLNVTVVNPAGPGFVTAFPAGAGVPNASTLNYVGGAVVPNLVEVGTGSMGQVSFYSQNQTDLVVDLEGYTTENGTGLYSALSPTRICDTRVTGPSSPSNQCDNGVAQAAGRVTAAQPLTINVGNDGDAGVGTFGVPADATAAVLNITDTNAAAAGFVTVYPQGSAEPNASNVNFSAGQTTANRVIVPLSATGDITLATTAPTDLVVDVSGYYSASGAQFSAESAPVRICDTRPASSFSPGNQCTVHGAIAGGNANQLSINVRGLAAVPAGATAAVVNVTGIGPTLPTFLTVFGSGTVPNASDLNLGAGETRANLDVATVNPTNGKITIWNQTGSLNVIVDVLGWYAPPPG